MKTNFPFEPLSAEQDHQLETWEYSPDPSQRLFTDFYPLTRKALMNEYYQNMKECATLEEKEDAWQSLYNTLNKLKEDYLKDWKMLLEIQQAMTGSYCPIKFKLMLDEED